MLLERKNLPGEILEEVARRKPLLKNYRVKKALAFHPRTPRLVTLRLLRDLYLMDLVQLDTFAGHSDGVETECGGSADFAAAAAAAWTENHSGAARACASGWRASRGRARANRYHRSGQRVSDGSHKCCECFRAKNCRPGVVRTISLHRKWSISYNVRLALVRHPLSPLATVLAYLPELTVSDLRELASPGIVSESLRKYLQAEVQRRIRTGEKSARKDDTPGPAAASNQD